MLSRLRPTTTRKELTAWTTLGGSVTSYTSSILEMMASARKGSNERVSCRRRIQNEGCASKRSHTVAPHDFQLAANARRDGRLTQCSQRHSNTRVRFQVRARLGPKNMLEAAHALPKAMRHFMHEHHACHRNQQGREEDHHVSAEGAADGAATRHTSRHRVVRGWLIVEALRLVLYSAEPAKRTVEPFCTVRLGLHAATTPGGAEWADCAPCPRAVGGRVGTATQVE
jgi:hypothetical protein